MTLYFLIISVAVFSLIIGIVIGLIISFKLIAYKELTGFRYGYILGEHDTKKGNVAWIDPTDRYKDWKCDKSLIDSLYN